MESIGAINIFETKGTEYLFVIGYLIVLIGFWALANKPVKVVPGIKKAIGILSEKVMNLPGGVFHSKNHTWTYLEPSGDAKVGMDGLLQNITGEVRFNALLNPGDYVKKGSMLAEIEHNGKKLKIPAPVSGEIMDVNPGLNESHDELMDDPYRKYWIYKVKPDNWVEETSRLYLGDDARKWIKKELERFRDFLAESMSKHSPQTAMYALQEGGELRSDTMSELPGEVWEDFQKSFLDVS